VDDWREKHAKAQRKHAAKLKRMGVPRSDDLARALLAALRKVCHDKRRPPAKTEQLTINWTTRAVRQLEERGFKRRPAIERLVNTLLPDDPVHRIDGSQVIPGFDRKAIIGRIEKARRREAGKSGDQSAC